MNRSKIAQSVVIIIVIAINLISFFSPLLNNISYEFFIVNVFLLVLLFPIIMEINGKVNSTSKVAHYKNPIVFFILFQIIALIIKHFNSIELLLFETKYFIGIFLFTLINLYIIWLTIISYAPKHKILVYYLIVGILALIPIFEIYFLPQIYFYNPIIGYFPGTIYDDYISLDGKFFFYRVITIFLLMAFYFLAKSLNKKIGITVTIIIFSIYLIFIKPVLGFSTSNRSLQKQSKCIIENKNFKITSFCNFNEVLSKYRILEHEYEKSKIFSKIQLNLKQKVETYIFCDNFQKQRYFGSSGADVSKIWQNSIFLDENSFDENILHELVHSYSKNIGNGYLKLPHNYNFAALEGLPIFIEDNLLGYPLFELAKYFKEKDSSLSIKKLFIENKFFIYSPTVSYLISGSYVKYLVGKYGVQKFKKYYQNGNYTLTFGNKIEYDEKEFWGIIEKVELINFNEFEKLFSKVKPIYKKANNHFIAEQIQKADEFVKMNKLSDAIEIYNSIWEKYQNPRVFFKALNLLFKSEKYDSVEFIIGQNEDILKNTIYNDLLLYYKLKVELVKNHLTEAKKISYKLLSESVNKEIRQKTQIITDLMEYGKIDFTGYFLSKEYKTQILKENFEKNPQINFLEELIPYLSYKENVQYFTQIDLQNEKNIESMIFIGNYFLTNLDFENALIIKSRLENLANIPESQRFIEKVIWMNSNQNIIKNIKLN